jgi:hypothetical protein
MTVTNMKFNLKELHHESLPNMLDLINTHLKCVHRKGELFLRLSPTINYVFKIVHATS